jgi:lipoprotein-anchoring transpeptidase ErfK/SrfK
MRGGPIVVAGAALAAGAAVFAFNATKPQTPTVVAAPSIAQPPTGDRVFLTKPQLDQAIASGTLDRPVSSLLAVRAPLHFGDYSWDDRGVPAGPTWVRVDLGSQLMSVFRGGHEIGTAVIVYGGDNKQTPAGKLHILAKARDHRSSLYDAQMPYTLRLTGDGVSIHASSVRWGAATHGCIGVPFPFAERLFDAARVGDEVVVVGSPPRKTLS